MRIAKGIVSLFSVFALLAGTLTIAAYADTPSNATPLTFDDNNIVVSFGAMSDLHIRAQASDRDKKFINVLNKFKEIAGGSNKLNAVVIAGDLFDAAPNSEAPRIKGFLDTTLDSNDTEAIPAIGNHDAYFQNAFSNKNKFKDEFGDFVYKNPIEANTPEQVIDGNYHTIINGVHFISVTGIDGDHAIDNLSWLDKNLSIASKDNPDMPIFVETHVPPANTMYGSDEGGRWQSTTIGPVLEKYPQAVIFAGHTHASPFENTSIWRGAYTAIGTGTIDDGAHFVQVDKNGVVRVKTYTTSTDISEMKTPRADWIFETMPPIPMPPTNEEILSTKVPTADILDVDFADGTSKDNASNIKVKNMGNGNSKITDDNDLNKKIISFDGNCALGYTFTDTQYDKIKNTTSLECLFNLKEAPSSGTVDIMSNLQDSGQGLQYTSSHVLQYRIKIDDSFVVLEAENIEPHKWVHAVATYSNKDVRLYINGLLASRKKISGNITHPSNSSQTYCLGADVSSSGSYENPSKVQIGCARVFSKALNNIEVYRLFSEISNTKITFPEDAVFNATQKYTYAIPKATATDAIIGNIPVTVSVIDPDGDKVYYRRNSFSVWRVGNYKITYRANGFLLTKTLKVISEKSAEATLTLDKTNVTLGIGSTTMLTAKIDPADVDTVEKWKSSDTSIATVDNNGKITAIKEGTAIITVTTRDGKTASCTVNVSSIDTKTTLDDISETSSTNASNNSNPQTGNKHCFVPITVLFISVVTLGALIINKKKIAV